MGERGEAERKRGAAAPRGGPRGRAATPLPAAVWVLGFVSLLMDVSSEMVHGLLPVFLVVTLGASTVTLGIIEGLGEGVALIVKLFSGLLSDRLGRRKLLVLAGYGLSALTKPLFALAQGAGLVLLARLVDRMGKGIRGAPRDALIADVTPPAVQGAAYGLRQTLDTVGAVIGPLIALVLMELTGGDIRTVFWVAAIPGFLAVALIVFAVPEPVRPGTGSAAAPAFERAALRALGRPFWKIVVVGALAALALFSEAFLVLRALDAGFAMNHAPLVLVILSVVFALTAYPAGRLQDRIGGKGIVMTSLLALALAHFLFAFSSAPAPFVAALLFWGLHLGLSKGVFAALVAAAAPAAFRGTAFGVFNLVAGGMLLLGNGLAGLLWHLAGPRATFLAAAAVALAAMGAAGALIEGRRRRPDASSSG